MKRLIASFTVLLCLMLSACVTTDGEMQPNDQQAAVFNTQLGLGYLQQGRGELAIDKFRRALQADSSLLEARLGYAAALSSTGQMIEAESIYRGVVNDRPNDKGVIEAFAGFLCTQQLFEKAERVFINAIENGVYSGVGEGYSRFSACALAVGNAEHAELYIDHAIASDPRYSLALLQKGWISLDAGKAADALALIHRFEEIEPATADSLVLGLKAARATGHPDAERFNIVLKSRFPTVWRDLQRSE